MPGFNWREGQGQVRVPGQTIGNEVAAEGGDWRTQLPSGSRHRIVNKLLDTLKKHLPFSGEEELQNLAAVRFEESFFTTATSQSDYFRKISMKLLEIEVEYKPRLNSLQNDAASTSRFSQHPASLDSSSQIGSASGGDWQEEIYQKIKSMHEMYCPELNEMHQRMASKLLEQDALPPQPNKEQFEKLRYLKLVMERLIMFLWTNKDDIQPYHREKIVGVEKQIVNILNASRPRRSVSSLQQGQLTQPHTRVMQQSQMSQHTNGGQMNS